MTIKRLLKRTCGVLLSTGILVGLMACTSIPARFDMEYVYNCNADSVYFRKDVYIEKAGMDKMLDEFRVLIQQNPDQYTTSIDKFNETATKVQTLPTETYGGSVCYVVHVEDTKPYPVAPYSEYGIVTADSFYLSTIDNTTTNKKAALKTADAISDNTDQMFEWLMQYSETLINGFKLQVGFQTEIEQTNGVLSQDKKAVLFEGVDHVYKKVPELYAYCKNSSHTLAGDRKEWGKLENPVYTLTTTPTKTPTTTPTKTPTVTTTPKPQETVQPVVTPKPTSTPVPSVKSKTVKANLKQKYGTLYLTGLSRNKMCQVTRAEFKFNKGIKVCRDWIRIYRNNYMINRRGQGYYSGKKKSIIFKKKYYKWKFTTHIKVRKHSKWKEKPYHSRNVKIGLWVNKSWSAYIKSLK